jgi:hypothetical protein
LIQRINGTKEGNQMNEPGDTATDAWREALGVVDSLLGQTQPDRDKQLADLESTRPEV